MNGDIVKIRQLDYEDVINMLEYYNALNIQEASIISLINNKKNA